MTTPDVGFENRARDAGIDFAFYQQMQRLESLKELVKQGKVKPEVYRKLENEVFKLKQTRGPSLKPSRPELENGIIQNAPNNESKKVRASKRSPTEKLREEGSIRKSSRSSRHGSGVLRNRATSIASALSGRAKSAFRIQPESNTVLLEGKLLKFAKIKKKKRWVEVYAILYTDRVEFKASKDSKSTKSVKLTEDWFVSTVDEKGARKVVQRATEDTDSIASEDEENIERINESLQDSNAVMVMNNVFIIASLNANARKSTKILLACEDDMTRELWVAMTVEAIRDLREHAGFGELDRTFSKKGWRDLNGKTNTYVATKLGQELNKDVENLEVHDIDKKVNQWKTQGQKIAKHQFVQDWRSREALRMRVRNKKLEKELKMKEEELVEYKQLSAQEIEAVKQANEEVLAKEKEKNAVLKKNYDELMEKYRAEAHARNMQKKNDEARIKKRIRALQRRSIIPHSDEARHYKEELEKFKQKLATLQKAMNIDLDEMDWDGSLEQAEERMQECLKLILEGDTPKIKAKAQTDFDKWDQLVRGHQDFITREENKWKDWEEENHQLNLDAKQEMRDKFVPEEYRKGCSVNKLIELTGMKPKTAERIFKNKIFKFLWMEKREIGKIHGAALTNDYASQGLDIRELRAIYVSLPEEFEADNDGRKKQFRETMRAKLHNLTEKLKKGSLSPQEQMHNDYRDKPVPKHARPKNFKKQPRQKRKMNNKLKNNAAALEAFFKGGPGGGAKPKPKGKAKGSKAAAKGGDGFDPADPKWKKYLKMQKVLPETAIKQKMVMNGDDPNLWERIKNGGKAKSPPKEPEINPDAPEFKTYFNMKKSGLMDGAIKNKMLKDGQDPALWEKLVELKEKKSNPKKVAEPAKAKKQEPLNPDDPKWADYFRMRRLKLGEGQIMNKMQKDGKDPSLWPKLVALKEKNNLKKPSVNKLDIDEFAEIIEGPEAPKNGAPVPVEEEVTDVAEDLKRAMGKRKSKVKKQVQYDADGNVIKKKKRKKKSKSIYNEYEKKKRNSSKVGKTLLLQDAGDLVSRAKLGLDLDASGVKKSGRGLNIMNIEAQGRNGGRRKTLKKNVAVAALKDDSQLQDILDYILTDGEKDENGDRTMKFGDIYANFLELCDVLPGILYKGKRGGHLKYKGQMLLFGIHNEVKITIVT